MMTGMGQIGGDEMPEHDTRDLFQRVQDGDEDAARELYHQYLGRLVALARSRMSQRLGQKLDADDVIQSAFRSFFLRAREGQFTIERAGDLWSLLAAITKHKLLKKAEHFRQQKRNIAQDQPMTAGERGGNDPAFYEEPTEAEAVALSDEVEFLMRELDPLQRQMLQMRLQGQPIPEIAETVERSERTVRRFLGSFRDDLEQRLQSIREI
jgi:RNA polymerase sigma factor (sigma-70 family)